MKISWSSLGTSLCFVAGCAGSAPRGPTVADDTARAPRARSNTESRPVTTRTLEDVRRPARRAENELASPGLDEEFAVSRQVTALERSIELYQTFIERAGDDPRFAEAVRRSRGRIDDARLTICFLVDGAGAPSTTRPKSCDDGETR